MLLIYLLNRKLAYNANQSVSFRSGTNVEFIGDNQSGGIISPQDV